MTTPPTTTPAPPDPVPAPLPDPAALLERTRGSRAELYRATRTRLLRGLSTIDEEKATLRAEGHPTGFEGVGRPGGPAPGDRYAAYVRPALAGLEALDRYEAAVTAAEALRAELAGAFARLDGALAAAEREGDEVLDAGRVEHLLDLRRQLDAARLEHTGLVGDLDDAQPLRRSFVAKAERLRDAAIAVVHERLVHDLRTALDGARTRVEALRARAPEEVMPVRALVARWAARTGQPVPLPTLRWPTSGTDPFAPPTLVEP